MYTQEVLKKHQADGQPVDENDFEHLSLARFAHINRLGRYTFQKVEKFDDNGLGPLRSLTETVLTGGLEAARARGRKGGRYQSMSEN